MKDTQGFWKVIESGCGRRHVCSIRHPIKEGSRNLSFEIHAFQGGNEP